MGHLSPSHQWDLHRRNMFFLTLVRARGTSVSLRVQHIHLSCHRQAREARVWVEDEGRVVCLFMYRLNHSILRPLLESYNSPIVDKN